MLFTDEHKRRDRLIDINIALSKLNSCSNEPDFDTSAFFDVHGMESDNVSLTREDIVSHWEKCLTI